LLVQKRVFSWKKRKRKAKIIIVKEFEEKKQSPRRYSLQRSTAAAKKEFIECPSTTNGNTKINCHQVQ